VPGTMPQFIAGDTPATTAVSIFKKQTRREDFSSRRWFFLAAGLFL